MGPGTGRWTQRPGLQQETLRAKARGQPSSHVILTDIPGNVGAFVGPGTRQPLASPKGLKGLNGATQRIIKAMAVK